MWSEVSLDSYNQHVHKELFNCRQLPYKREANRLILTGAAASEVGSVYMVGDR